ncbi:hypothetical protein RD792_008822 [Penstemon davidsonii]|uniref:Uncharacterized protein n=1 Tax=Penstemon davidsonii TaxID=160366 RepID=A0ABR0DA69_9LAMI|nr:hypothetical protein RD792_008822 [Penstemon davidsonii]
MVLPLTLYTSNPYVSVVRHADLGLLCFPFHCSSASPIYLSDSTSSVCTLFFLSVLFFYNACIMDLVNSFLNNSLPGFSIHAFLAFFPVYLCYKALYYICRSVFSEDLAGKVVVITGASSGIGEHLAYEYGRRGAYLVIGARRENALREVADNAYWLGSPRAIPIRTDVSNVDDCKRLIEETVNQFGRLDHLVLNSGVTPVSLFKDIPDVTNITPAMASKAAVLSFFETLRAEFGSDVGITIVSPGLIESEMTKGKFLNQDGNIVVDQEMRDVVMSATPMESVARMAKAAVDSAYRGDRNLTFPFWYEALFLIKICFHEATDLFQRWFFITEPGVPAREAISKKIVDLPLLKDILWPDSIRSPKIKKN